MREKTKKDRDKREEGELIGFMARFRIYYQRYIITGDFRLHYFSADHYAATV